MIPYEDLGKVNAPYAAELEDAFRRVLNRGWYILGENVEAFEKEFAAWCGTEYCVGVASGLDALILSLRALNLHPGDEVLVPSNTYIATILAILENNLTPVLVEPDPRTCNIDPNRITAHVTGRTRAVMVVHLYGQSCEMQPIVDICTAKGLHLLEDCAQSHGAEYNGKRTGSFGIAGAFSFYPTKNLGALGDGGAVTTNDRAMYETVKKLRNYGSAKKYINDIPGVNSRLDEVQAAFLRVKLKRLDEVTRHKQHLAALYHQRLGRLFLLPATAPGCGHVYHIFNIRHSRRDDLRQYLAEKGIGTEIHYPVAPHRQEALRTLFPDRRFPISEEMHATTLSLPISTCHTAAEINTVIDTLNAFEA